jgi:hypothetical protein
MYPQMSEIASISRAKFLKSIEKPNPLANRKLEVGVMTKNISRLDAFSGGRSKLSLDVVNNSAQFVIDRPPRGLMSFIELKGYRENELVAVKKIKV